MIRYPPDWQRQMQMQINPYENDLFWGFVEGRGEEGRGGFMSY